MQQTYQCMWDKFVFFTTHLSTGKQPCLSASPFHIRCFIQALSEEGKASSTVRGYMSGTADVHTSAGYNDPTSNYLVSKHLKGLHVGCSTFPLALLRAMYALMFYGFLRISEVTKHQHNFLIQHFLVKSAFIKLNFQSYKSSTAKPFHLEVHAIKSIVHVLVNGSCSILKLEAVMHALCSVLLIRNRSPDAISLKILQTAVKQALLNHIITPHSFIRVVSFVKPNK